MKPFWVQFEKRKPGCVIAETSDAALEAARVAAKFDPTSAVPLPFPAFPIIAPADFKAAALCKQPRVCAGHSACQSRAGKKCGAR